MKTTEIRIERTRSYGHYRITGLVNGIEVSAITTDSEAFDYLNDEDNEEKSQQALAHCEMKLELAYEIFEIIKAYEQELRATYEELRDAFGPLDSSTQRAFLECNVIDELLIKINENETI